MFNANRITNVAWGASVNIIPVNPRAARCRVLKDFLCCRHRESLWCHYNRRNPLVNPRFYRQENDKEGPVTQ